MDVSCWIHNVVRMFPVSLRLQVVWFSWRSGLTTYAFCHGIFMLIRSGIWITCCWSHVFFNNWTENFKVHMALLSMLCSFANFFYHRFRWNTGPCENFTWIPNIKPKILWFAYGHLWIIYVHKFLGFLGCNPFFFGTFSKADGLPGGARNMVITQLEVVIIVP